MHISLDNIYTNISSGLNCFFPFEFAFELIFPRTARWIKPWKSVKLWNKSETKKKISVDDKEWLMISHGLPMQLIRYSDWPESDLGAEDTMGTYSMGTGVLVSVEGWPVCRLPLKDRRKSYKQINFSYKSLAKLMTHLHQDNSEQKN